MMRTSCIRRDLAITNSFLKILTRLVMAEMNLKMTMELLIQDADP